MNARRERMWAAVERFDNLPLPGPLKRFEPRNRKPMLEKSPLGASGVARLALIGVALVATAIRSGPLVKVLTAITVVAVTLALRFWHRARSQEWECLEPPEGAGNEPA